MFTQDGFNFRWLFKPAAGNESRFPCVRFVRRIFHDKVATCEAERLFGTLALTQPGVSGQLHRGLRN